LAAYNPVPFLVKSVWKDVVRSWNPVVDPDPEPVAAVEVYPILTVPIFTSIPIQSIVFALEPRYVILLAKRISPPALKNCLRWSAELNVTSSKCTSVPFQPI
jgi:hypothetical protein